jgi:hypothetical protein
VPDSLGVLWHALHSTATRAVVVLYADLDVLDDVGTLADPRWQIERLATLDEVLSAPKDTLILLVPPEPEQAATVRDLDGSREQLMDRQAPVVVFLRRGGPGEAALQEAIGLTSWLRGRVVDPEAEADLDVAAARAEFQQVTGQSPEDWLARERSNPTPASARDLGLTYRALLLEQVDDPG